MANTALATASGLVNEVTHVSADKLTYSHNMALIINIPTWFILSSFLMLLLIQVLLPVYLLLLLALKPFGVHKIWHKPDYRFIFSIALIRYFWATFLLIFFLYGSIKSGFLNQSTPILGDAYAGFVSDHDDEYIEGSNPDDLLEEQLKALDEQRKANLEVIYKSKAVHLLQKQILAAFIYNYEADSFSRCAHPQNTRVIELNDYELLTVKKSETAEVGYEFSVIACHSPGINSIKTSSSSPK